MFAILLSLFSACSPEIACTEIFAYSSTITLVDSSGFPIEEADISYTVNGQEGTYIESFGGGVFAVGGEEAGDFVVTVHAEQNIEDDPTCWNVGTGTAEYTIEADECHVIGQEIDLALTWELLCE